jgi:hypothetical protein
MLVSNFLNVRGYAGKQAGCLRSKLARANALAECAG